MPQVMQQPGGVHIDPSMVNTAWTKLGGGSGGGSTTASGAKIGNIK
jgi:hypothetical protein